MKKTTKKTVAAVAPRTSEGPKTVTLTRSTAPRKGSSIVFLIPGVRGGIKVARTAFAAEPPMTLEVLGSPFAPPVVHLSKNSARLLAQR